MQNNKFVLFALLALLVSTCACSKVVKPDLPSIPTYASAPAPCPTPLRCGIMMNSGDALAVSYTRQIAETLSKLNVPATAFPPDDYVTRSQRLALDRVILISGINPRTNDGSQGLATDVELTVEVYDAKTKQKLGASSAWGRQIAQPKAPIAPLAIQVYPIAVDNLVKIPEFMKLLSQ